MKYLETPKLTEWTAELSDATLGHSHRIIDGRVEAYSMKRAGNDKKYAYALGQRYVAEIEEMEQVLAETLERTHPAKQRLLLQQKRKRSFSAATAAEAGALINALGPLSSAKRACTTGSRAFPESTTNAGSRFRSQSFDSTYLDSFTCSKTTLGDFSELATRRLMTDLILTLNASFPDYDFSTIKPSQFEKLNVKMVRDRIFERLSELASFKATKAEEWLVDLWAAINEAIDFSDCDVYAFHEKDLEEDSLWSFHYFFVNKSLRRIVFFTCVEKIDEECRQQFERDETEENQSFVPATESQLLVDDFDWDPSADVAGGIAIPISTV